jgi:hypothetical protein
LRIAFDLPDDKSDCPGRSSRPLVPFRCEDLKADSISGEVRRRKCHK